MSKKIGYLFIFIGIISMIGALGLYAWNKYEDQKAGQMAQSSLMVVKENIVQATTETSKVDGKEQIIIDEIIEEISTEMTTVEIDGHLYIGSISIPVLDIELPIMSDWSYDKLKIAPCRQFGSVFTNDLVIAGHNYQKHFGKLKQLVAGDVVYITDMQGEVYTYTVQLVEEISATSVETARDSEYSLVLYTCTTGGEKRVAVFCS